MNWLKDNLNWIKWIIGIAWSILLAYGTYQKMRWDIDDIKKDMERANIIELQANIEAVKNQLDMMFQSNENIKDQFNIVIEHLLNNP